MGSRLVRWTGEALDKAQHVVFAKRKVGGRNMDNLNGFYKLEEDENQEQLFIKKENKKNKEFSELLAGKFIAKIGAQPGFKYTDNFAVGEPGRLKNEETGDESTVIVQPKLDAKPLLKKRYSFHERFSRQIVKIVNGFKKDEFAAILVLSALIGDYSVHTGNFMKKKNGSPVRVDFGSAMRNLFKFGFDQNILCEPPKTKWYKHYMQLWTRDKENQEAISQFIKDNAEYLNPEKLGHFMKEACEELFETEYANASLKDLIKIHEHLFGEKPKFTQEELDAIKQNKLDRKEMVKLNKELDNIQKEIDNLVSKIKQSTYMNDITQMESKIKELKMKQGDIRSRIFDIEHAPHANIMMNCKQQIKYNIIEAAKKGMEARVMRLHTEEVKELSKPPKQLMKEASPWIKDPKSGVYQRNPKYPQKENGSAIYTHERSIDKTPNHPPTSSPS